MLPPARYKLALSSMLAAQPGTIKIQVILARFDACKADNTRLGAGKNGRPHTDIPLRQQKDAIQVALALGLLQLQ